MYIHLNVHSCTYVLVLYIQVGWRNRKAKAGGEGRKGVTNEGQQANHLQRLHSPLKRNYSYLPSQFCSLTDDGGSARVLTLLTC